MQKFAAVLLLLLTGCGRESSARRESAETAPPFTSDATQQTTDRTECSAAAMIAVFSGPGQRFKFESKSHPNNWFRYLGESDGNPASISLATIGDVVKQIDLIIGISRNPRGGELALVENTCNELCRVIFVHAESRTDARRMVDQLVREQPAGKQERFLEGWRFGTSTVGFEDGSATLMVYAYRD